MSGSARYHLFVEHDPRNGVCVLETANLHPPLRRYERGAKTVHLLGHPIAGGQRDDRAVLSAYERSRDLPGFAAALDGGFLILVEDGAARRLEVISDRFGSFAFYYALERGRLLGSLSLLALAKRKMERRIDEEGCFEFLYFRRLFGDRSLERASRYLDSASILCHDRDGVGVAKYWQPDYAGTPLSAEEGGEAIAAALRESMAAHMEARDEGRRYALFLSGGLDSRALLAAAQEPPDCVTTCARRNNESEVAEAVARAAGARFRFIARPERPYDGHIDNAVWLSGGQQIFTEAHFLAYDRELHDDADCYFFGLGLDILLGGLYLPKRPVRWFGREALHFRLTPLTDDLAGDFIGGVKYRLTSSDPWQFVRAEHRARLADHLRAAITEVARRGEALGAEGYDLWEYLHLHNLSRHYSFPMIQSVRGFAECRAPGLSNGILDISLRLPAELKVNSSAYLRALNRLAPKLMTIRSANTNLRAGLPFRVQSALRAARVAGNRALGTRFRVSPPADERSWPRPREVLAASPELQSAVAGLGRSDRLACLPFLDLDAVERAANEHKDGRHDHAVALFVLLTLDRALARLG